MINVTYNAITSTGLKKYYLSAHNNNTSVYNNKIMQSKVLRYSVFQSLNLGDYHKYIRKADTEAWLKWLYW